MNHKSNTIADVQSIVREAGRVSALAGGTKPGLLCSDEGVELIEVIGLDGILEYQPEEYTFTALAGTQLHEINQALDEHGQYLPFDPPLVRRGASLGGTVAAGLSGPGRYHYGGVRDFLLGVKFVDGRTRLVSGGGKVVKNVAGFDLPKLMVGSLGGFGVMVELSFKVFPKPAVFITKRFVYPNLDQSLEKMQTASTARLDLDALDLQPLNEGVALWVRLSGLEATLSTRLARLEQLLGEGVTLIGSEDQAVWEAAREFDWVPDGWSLIKLPVTPGRIPGLEKDLAQIGGFRRYSVGGQVAWIALEDSLERLESILNAQGLNALVLWGKPGIRRLGDLRGRLFYKRIKSVLDPDHRYVEV
jgi:glycolate dehydrogenase FAD-binding subunit